MNITYTLDERELCGLAVDKINKTLLEWQSEPILLMLSAGSVMTLTEGIAIDALGGHVTLAVLDERYSKDFSVNNFARLAKTPFYKHALLAGAQVINTQVKEGESQYHLTARYESTLQMWAGKHKDGKVLVTLGMGPDGHIAGIMPYPENPGQFSELFESDNQWIVGYHATGKNIYEERVTTTLSFLRSRVDRAIVYIAGDNKGEAMRRALLKKGNLHVTPACIMHEMKDIYVYTDIAT